MLINVVMRFGGWQPSPDPPKSSGHLAAVSSFPVQAQPHGVHKPLPLSALQTTQLPS